MTDNENEQVEKKIKPKLEHVALSEESSQKLDHWIEQINAKKKIRVPRRELINWWLKRSPDNLSNSEVNILIEEFYDEESYLRQLLRDVKKAKESGQTEPTLEVVVRQKRSEQVKRDASADLSPMEPDTNS